TSTKSWRACVATCGLCSVAVCSTVSTPASAARTASRATIEATTSVVGAAFTSMPRTDSPAARSVRAKASPRWPALPGPRVVRFRRRLPFAVEQLAPDQHAPDLVRAGADLVQFRVAQDSAGRVLVDVAVAAEALDRFERDLHRVGRGMQQARGRIDARLVAAV